MKARLQLKLHLLWRRFALENDIATGDVRLDLSESGIAAHGR
jgi:hypothetical protein